MKTVRARSKEMPCLRTFAAALIGALDAQDLDRELVVAARYLPAGEGLGVPPTLGNNSTPAVS